MMNGVCLQESLEETMTNLSQQIATQINAYHSLDAVKAAVQEWASVSDGSLDALGRALAAHRDDEFELTEDDWQQLKELGLAYDDDTDAATREEDMRRIQAYRETGHAIAHETVSAWLQSRGTDDELPCPR